MFVFDKICWLSFGCAVRKRDLKVDRPIFWLGSISMPAESTPTLWFPPLNPVVWSLPAKIKFDPKTCFFARILVSKKHEGIDLGDNLVGISSGWFVPHGRTASGLRKPVVDTSEQLWLDWPPNAK